MNVLLSMGQNKSLEIISFNEQFNCVEYYKNSDSCDNVFGDPEIMPKIIGGFDTIGYLLHYPADMGRFKISGKVYINMLIDSSGNIKCYRILSGLGDPFNEEVIRFIARLKFTPAFNLGRPIEYDYTLPISFTWTEGKKRKKN